MAGFLTPLDLRYIDGRSWEVRAPFDYAVGSPDSDIIVRVPVGFITDFASIPKILWPLMPPTGWYGKIAVIHDILYQRGRIDNREISRKYADDVMNEGMCILAASWVLEHGRSTPGYPQLPQGELRSLMEREAIYRGIRAGGWVTWNKYRHAEQSAAGEVR